jgi:hypothetical protein
MRTPAGASHLQARDLSRVDLARPYPRGERVVDDVEQCDRGAEWFRQLDRVPERCVCVQAEVGGHEYLFEAHWNHHELQRRKMCQ